MHKQPGLISKTFLVDVPIAAEIATLRVVVQLKRTGLQAQAGTPRCRHKQVLHVAGTGSWPASFLQLLDADFEHSALKLR